MMTNNIVFKPASVDDFETILCLEKDSFNLHDRLDRETLIELFSEFSEGFFIITVDGITAGYAVFIIEDGEGYIESIAVDPGFRRRGLALLALKFMIKIIGDRNLKKINLHVRMDNTAAISLYEKEGFARTGIAPGFYKDGESAYIYSRKADLN